MTAQEKERITRLRGEGKSYGAIATLLGISASKVKSYCTMAKSITRIEVKKPDLLQRKRVAAYARVSMDTERLMHSLSVQVSYYSELIQNTPGWEYAGVYADEGISGTKMDSRPEFVRMLADCEAGKIDIIFTQSLSRFARNTVDTLNVVRRLKELGIEVRFEKENIWTFDSKGELLITIMASFAQEEVRSLSENVKWGLRKRFEQGVPNGRFHVYGYRWEGDHLVIQPDEATIVRRIFRISFRVSPGWRLNASLRQKASPQPRAADFDEETLKQLFLSALNKLVGKRNEIRDSFDAIRSTVFDTDALEAELAQVEAEMSIAAEQVARSIRENAMVALDQSAYRARHDALCDRYESLKARCEELKETISDKQTRLAAIDDFLRTLMKQEALSTTFDPMTYHILVERMTVYSKARVMVRFKNGMEIQA